MGHNTKGARSERELVNRLSDRGWFPMRAGASGSATENELPDVHVGDGNITVAVEAKASGGDPIYVGADDDYHAGDEVGDLVLFAMAFRSVPLIGARFDREQWHFFPPGDLHSTGQSVRVKKEDLPDGIHIDDLHRVEEILNGDGP